MTNCLQVTTRIPIPETLSPDLVLTAIKTYEPLIAANPYLDRYERRPVPIESLVGDNFFSEDGQRLQAFVVHDRVPIMMGLSKGVVIPCVFQSFDKGVRCRADAQSGVTVRSCYEVRMRGEVPLGGNETDEAASGGKQEALVKGDWELVETARIECGSLVKPFVKKSFSSSHREILQRVVWDIERGELAKNTGTQPVLQGASALGPV
jgi:hypothetical protein